MHSTQGPMTLKQRLAHVKNSYIEFLYADHNSSRYIREALERFLERLPEGFTGISVGSGTTKIHENFKNLDLREAPNVDIVASIENTPCDDNSFDALVAQEILEHVQHLEPAMAEIHRILKPGGRAYLQTPFVIGVHPSPEDFWRFTEDGLSELARQAGLTVEESGVSVGPAAGFYRMTVEFWAILLSAIWGRLYMPAKAVAALIFYPVKWLEPLMMRSAERHRIAGGFYIVCRKDG